MQKIVSLIIFLFGYVAISQEHSLKISKTAVSLLLGVILWAIAIIGGAHGVETAITEASAEIFELVIFLLSAMTLVEILTHYGLFDLVYVKLLKLHLQDKSQFIILTLLAFVSSAFLDNLTTTIVFLQIARRFFRGQNLLRTSAAIVISANAGGAFSPIGDVTTTMLWLAGKFSASTVILQGLAPSLTVFLVSTTLIRRGIVSDTRDIRTAKTLKIGRAEWLIISLCLGSFLLPLVMTVLHLPPYIGILLGLGIVWFVVDALRIRLPERTSLMVSIEKFFQKTDIASLYFFIGILLAIGALRHIGLLDDISAALFQGTSDGRIIGSNILIGILSAVFDNIPLTAAAMDIVKTQDVRLWVLLALTVGVGGSIFAVGSAPGIIAMSMVKDLTFRVYFSFATLPALAGYAAGIAVWYIQYSIM